MTEESPAATEFESAPNRPEAESSARASADSAPIVEQSFLGLNDSDRRILIVFVFAGLLLMAMHVWRLKQHGWETISLDRPPDRRLEFQVDINHSTWVEWMQLAGIGETLARTIIEDREHRGPFRSIDDVDRVKGIGSAKLAAIRPHLYCSDCPESTGGTSSD